MANRLTDKLRLEVTFITKEGAIAIRMVDDLPQTINSAAKTLRARYVVGAFDWDAAENCPIWSVYDIKRSRSVVPGTQQRALPLPLKQFVNESSDGAVMYAMALLGGSK